MLCQCNPSDRMGLHLNSMHIMRCNGPGEKRRIEVEEKEGKEMDRNIEYYIKSYVFFMWQHSCHAM